MCGPLASPKWKSSQKSFSAAINKRSRRRISSRVASIWFVYDAVIWHREVKTSHAKHDRNTKSNMKGFTLTIVKNVFTPNQGEPNFRIFPWRLAANLLANKKWFPAIRRSIRVRTPPQPYAKFHRLADLWRQGEEKVFRETNKTFSRIQIFTQQQRWHHARHSLRHVVDVQLHELTPEVVHVQVVSLALKVSKTIFFVNETISGMKRKNFSYFHTTNKEALKVNPPSGRGNIEHIGADPIQAVNRLAHSPEWPLEAPIDPHARFNPFGLLIIPSTVM